MGKKGLRSRSSTQALPDDDFEDQGILSYEETCSFDEGDIECLRTSGMFPKQTVFKSFDPLIQPDFISKTWICFPEYPFSLGMSFPFSGIVSEFFEVTGISYIQAMPMLWRILFWIDHLNRSKGFNIGLADLASVYDLTTFGSSRFLLRVKPNKTHLVFKSKQNDGAWKEKYFFVKRDSIPHGDSLPLAWVTKVAKFEELAPASGKTEEKVQEFLALPAADRSFKLEHQSLQEASSSTPSMSTGSKATRSNTRFSLSDLDEAMSKGHLKIKKEKASPSTESKKPAKDQSTKPPVAKKRKSSEILDFSLDNAGIDEASKKLMSFSQIVLDHIARQADEIRLEAERSFKDHEKASKAAIKDLSTKVEKLTKEKAVAEEEHAQELEEVISGLKADFAKVIWEAKIQMAEDVANAGSWDVAGWRAALAKLTGEQVEADEDPAYEEEKKEEGKAGGDEGQTSRV